MNEEDEEGVVAMTSIIEPMTNEAEGKPCVVCAQ
jgi:hypothetical protein